MQFIELGTNLDDFRLLIELKRSAVDSIIFSSPATWVLKNPIEATNVDILEIFRVFTENEMLKTKYTELK